MINANPLHILVTGANGFVGRALCESASKLGHQVKAATRTPYDFGAQIQNVPMASLESLAHTQTSMVDGVFPSLEGVDTVIHLAARVHVMKESVSEVLDAYRVINVAGTLAFAKDCMKVGVRRFIYISSIKVNGESTNLGRSFRADDVPAPQDPYGISKWEAELALKDLVKNSTMELVIIRPPLIYGPGVGANFAAMLKVLSHGIPLPFGAIKNARSLVGVDNLIDLILTCVKHPGAAGQVFLVSDGQDVSTTVLLRKLARCLGVRPLLLPIPKSWLTAIAHCLGKGAIANRLLSSLQVNIAHTCERLGWCPPFTLDQGLEKTVRWYEKK